MDEHRTDECPLLQPSRSLGHRGRAIGVYCRVPDGRVRVPPTDELRRFCLAGQWPRCPVYRRHAPARIS